MTVLGMSDMTARYVAALVRDGDGFDYSKWYRENRRSQSGPKPTDGELDLSSATVNPCLDDGTAKPAARAEVNLRAERSSLATAVGNVPILTVRGLQQGDGATADRARMLLQRPPAPTLATKRADQNSPPVSETVGSSPQAMKRDLAEVAETWKEFQSSRDRDAVYGYLESVFDLVREWERRGRVDKKARRAVRICGLKGWKNTEPYAVVIACTSEPGKVNRKTISKWSRVLRYLASCPPSKESLRDFIKRKGGINACASRFARRLGRKAM